jgi:uncharacterized Fe-S cluster-containing radical SAM superfamily enzyme
MNKELIRQLRDDKETRRAIADPFGIGDDAMLAALNTLSNEPVKGEMITIEVSGYMWVRGKYVCTATDGRVQVRTSDWDHEIYEGKRVALVIKGEKGGE